MEIKQEHREWLIANINNYECAKNGYIRNLELDVLKTVDFKKQKIKYIYYEDEFPHSLKSQKIITLLKKNNYKYIGRDGVNYIYILKSY
jgi:hypothetical protein